MARRKERPVRAVRRAVFDASDRRIPRAWAWFRLLEASKMNREFDTRNELTVSVGGHTANWLSKRRR